MIEVSEKGVRAEGNIKELLNDWMNATRAVYSLLAKKTGLKPASKIFASSLQFAANDAANELREKGELPNE